MNFTLFDFSRYGIYPLTAYKSRQQIPPLTKIRPLTPEVSESVKSASPEPVDVEARRVVNMMCNVKPKDQASCDLMVSFALKRWLSLPYKPRYLVRFFSGNDNTLFVPLSTEFGINVEIVLFVCFK